MSPDSVTSLGDRQPERNIPSLSPGTRHSGAQPSQQQEAHLSVQDQIQAGSEQDATIRKWLSRFPVSGRGLSRARHLQVSKHGRKETGQNFKDKQKQTNSGRNTAVCFSPRNRTIVKTNLFMAILMDGCLH